MRRTTDKQRAASRANAQKSTGPRTPAGKARSSLNALKHGIFAAKPDLPHEDPAELRRLTTRYRNQYRPRTREARALVDSLARNEWHLLRLRRIETILWNLEGPDSSRSDVFLRHYCAFDRLQRAITSHDRAFHQNLKALSQLQTSETKTTSAISAPFRDFPLTPTPRLVEDGCI